MLQDHDDLSSAEASGPTAADFANGRELPGQL